jgi:hypothetical protein
MVNNINNNSIDFDSFNFDNHSSPISELWTRIFGFYLIIVFILCIILNSILLLVFYRNKELRIPFNMLIMFITSLNLLSTIQFPFVIHSSFSHKWTSFKYGCILSAFIMVLLLLFEYFNFKSNIFVYLSILLVVCMFI